MASPPGSSPPRRDGTPIFGGVGDKIDRSQSLPDDAPRLTVDALVAFGGVEVKHEK